MDKTDKTRLQHHEEHEIAELIRLMFDSTPFCCVSLDEYMNLIECNLESVKMFQLKDQREFIEKFFELSPKFQPNGLCSKEGIAQKIQEVLQNGRISFEWLHQNSQKEPIPTEVTLVRMEFKEKPIVFGFVRDLRELKKTQNALEQERLLLKSILQWSPACFSIVVDDAIRFATPHMQDFFGVSEGEKLSHFFHDSELPKTLYKELLEKQFINWRAVTMKTKSGELKEMLAHFVLADYHDEKGILAWLIDVTQMRNVESDLRKARDTAEQLARAKSEFLANMSHEIRTPMNAVLGMLHIIQQTKLSEKQMNYIRTTEQSAKHLLDIINDILDFSRIEAGKMFLEPTFFNVRHVVEETLGVVKDEIVKKNLGYSLEFAPNIPPIVYGDKARVRQILLNMLNNAVKFTKTGNVSLSVYPGKRTDDKGEDYIVLIFAVNDSGVGMSDEEIRNLFSPFSQLDSSLTRKYGGIGLGLSISKRLVEMMDGNIWCKSREDEGTTFYFSTKFALPVPKRGKRRETGDGRPEEDASAPLTVIESVEEDDKTPKADDFTKAVVPSTKLLQPLPSGLPPTRRRKTDPSTSDPVVIPRRFRGMPILLVEDNKINQLVAKEMLKQHGFHIDVAENGREAIERVQAKQYGLVLMDIQMPEMDGFQAVEVIREHPHYIELPIVAMTAHALTGYREQCLEKGMNDYITKPIDPEKLYEIVVKWGKPIKPRKKRSE